MGRRAPGALTVCPSRSCSPRSRMTAARRVAKPSGEEGSAGVGSPPLESMGGGQAGTRADAAAAGALVFAVLAGWRRYTVTVRDSKRFAEPLALPRSCPPYVRDQRISRTHDRIM
jgi:hypothetical protein